MIAAGGWLRSKGLLKIILLLQPIVYAVMFFDVPVLRQFIGFIYFTFVPGFLLTKLLKADEFSRLDTFLFSGALGIAFLVIAGLMINELGYLCGISRPLLLIPLAVVLNSLILICGVLASLRSGNNVLRTGARARCTQMSRVYLLAPILLCLPLLSIWGATWAKVYGSNIILLATIAAIALLFATGTISEKILGPKLYPLAIFVIAISLLYHAALISNNLIHYGSDVPGEVFAARIVEKNAHWSPINPYPGDSSVGRTYAMLSLTILPSIYSNLLNLDLMWVFKIVYPVIFSLVPLGVYSIARRFVNDKYAFISAFLFMAYQTFYGEMLGLNKQMIGELFFVLLLFVIISKKLKTIIRTILFTVLSFALVVSHYALAEILLFLISFALILLIIFRRPRKNITLAMVLIFFSIMFCWYLFTSSSAVFDSFLSFGDRLYNQLDEFFNPESRGAEVLRGLGLEAPPSAWNAISRAFAYLVQGLIGVGFIRLATDRKRVLVGIEHFLLALFAVTLLGALVLVPGLANTLNMTRFYHILLFILSPLCVLGAETIAGFISKRKKDLTMSVLILMVLTPYFLFQTGFVYEVTGSYNWSLALSKRRMSEFRPYTEFGEIDEYGVYGAQWLAKNAMAEYVPIYADNLARMSELRAYGDVYIAHVELLSKTTRVMVRGLVYLNRLNTIGGIVVGQNYVSNTSELRFLQDLNCIYSNGGSVIYKNSP